MSYTTTDLATHVLRHLRVIDATEDADDETEHRDFVIATYRAKWEELSAHGNELTYWPYDTIPRPILLILRDLIALEVQSSFGQPIAPEEKAAREDLILKRLRRHTAMQSSGKPATAVYY